MLTETLLFGALLAANVSSAPAPEGGSFLRYRATGVRDAATAATVVTCTNLGATATISVDIIEFNNTLDCHLEVLVGTFASGTFASRNTAIYNEDATCAVAPNTRQGDLEIRVNPATRLICTVQIVDPAAATPAYMEKLTQFDRNGEPLSSVIFDDDFESGVTSAWSETS